MSVHSPESEDPLSDDWIDQFQSHQHFYKENIYYVYLTFIYINRHNEIEHVKHEPFLFTVPNTIVKAELVHLLKTHSAIYEGGDHYSLLSLLKYNVHLDPCEISTYLSAPSTREHEKDLEIIPSIADISFSKTIHFFQDVNELIFVMYNKKEPTLHKTQHKTQHKN